MYFPQTIYIATITFKKQSALQKITVLGCHEIKLNRGREVGTERLWKTFWAVGWDLAVSRQHQAGIWIFHLPLLLAQSASGVSGHVRKISP